MIDFSFLYGGRESGSTPHRYGQALKAGHAIPAAQQHAVAASAAALGLFALVRMGGWAHVMAAGVALVVKLATPPPPVGSAPPQDPNVVRAEAIRRTARDACQAQHWQVCIIELNEAKALDPEGDEEPDVQALRREAHDHP